MTRYLTTKDVASLLHISVRTLERFRVEGTGPVFHKAGRGRRARVLYKLTDVQAWLAEQAFQSTSEF